MLLELKITQSANSQSLRPKPTNFQSFMLCGNGLCLEKILSLPENTKECGKRESGTPNRAGLIVLLPMSLALAGALEDGQIPTIIRKVLVNMARQIIPQSRFQGLAYSDKEGIKSSYKWAQSVDYRTDPTKLLILPKTAKVSGTVVTDLIMDGDRQSTDFYSYGDSGNIYKRTSAEVWSNLHTVPDSHANGMKYYGEDGYLYYTSDTVIGRYGPFGGTKNFTDDFLGSEGGVPLNTSCLDFEATSSMYATAPDDATLSITGDITLEGCWKMESLPAAAAQMVLISKWDKNSDERSYKFDLAGISGYFGDGSDGALTISTSTPVSKSGGRKSSVG